MIHMTKTSIVTVVFLLIASTTHAGTVTINAQQDNTLYESATGSLSNAQGSAMFAGRTSQPSNSIRRALISFDITSAIPSDSIIDSVSLTLHMTAANIQNETIYLHRVTSAWGEGTSLAAGGQGGGGLSTTGDATWIHTFYDNQFWNNPGGDFDPTSSATQIVGNVGFYTWGSNTQMISDVQSWLNNPSTNFGWIILGNETVGGSSKRFETDEYADPLLRPSLSVSFSPIPEPASLILLGLSSVAMISRRLYL